MKVIELCKQYGYDDSRLGHSKDKKINNPNDEVIAYYKNDISVLYLSKSKNKAKVFYLVSSNISTRSYHLVRQDLEKCCCYFDKGVILNKEAYQGVYDKIFIGAI